MRTCSGEVKVAKAAARRVPARSSLARVRVRVGVRVRVSEEQPG